MFERRSCITIVMQQIAVFFKSMWKPELETCHTRHFRADESATALETCLDDDNEMTIETIKDVPYVCVERIVK